MDDKLKLKKIEAYLSNERTFLSYIRTSAAVLVLAVGMFKFFEDKRVIYMGYGVLAIGLFIIILGMYRFIQQRERIVNLKPEKIENIEGENK